MDSKKKGSLKTKIVIMTVLPIIVLGAVIAVSSAGRFRKSIYSEMNNELKNMAYTIVNTYDRMYPGDYAVVTNNTLAALQKGGQYIASSQEYLDNIKEDTGFDITFFYGDTRYLTTLADDKGNRITGTSSNSAIRIAVIDQDEPHFYDNIKVNDKKFCAYYMPIHNSDGKCIGMIGVLKGINEVNGLIARSVTPIVMISIAFTVLAGAIAVAFSTSILKAFGRIKNFLVAVQNGDLTKQIDEVTLTRNDEIGQMGNAASTMQHSLRQLIERDALTMLYNRRYANDRLAKLLEQNDKGVFAAIGDIDYFKKINDTYGHIAGDEVLVNVAAVLKNHMVGKGFSARWGGEEFLIVYEHIQSENAYNDLCSLLDKIHEICIDYQGQNIKVNMSFGGIAVTNNQRDIDEIIRMADEKLYYAKEHGRNQVVV